MMKTCPHCRFLVSDGATVCSVCHADITAPPVPATVGAGFAVAPGVHGAPGSLLPGNVAPGSSAPNGMQPPPLWGPGGGMPPAPAPRTSPARVVLILCAVAAVGIVGLGVLAIGAVTLVANPTEIASEDVMWRDYQDPDGRFQVDLPGEPVVDIVEVPATFGGQDDMEVVNVFNSDFVTSVSVNEGVIADGMTFADTPFSPSGAERGVEAFGFLDAEVVRHAIVEGTGNTQMSLELNGTVDGQPAVMLSRVVLVGPDLYETSVVGPRDQRAELLEIHDRLAESFRAPAGA